MTESKTTQAKDAHHHDWEHFGDATDDLPNRERRCAVCKEWQHVGLKGPKVSWLDGRA